MSQNTYSRCLSNEYESRSILIPLLDMDIYIQNSQKILILALFFGTYSYNSVYLFPKGNKYIG